VARHSGGEVTAWASKFVQPLAVHCAESSFLLAQRQVVLPAVWPCEQPSDSDFAMTDMYVEGAMDGVNVHSLVVRMDCRSRKVRHTCASKS
jgi:hypothetical protein